MYSHYMTGKSPRQFSPDRLAFPQRICYYIGTHLVCPLGVILSVTYLSSRTLAFGVILNVMKDLFCYCPQQLT